MTLLPTACRRRPDNPPRGFMGAESPDCYCCLQGESNAQCGRVVGLAYPVLLDILNVDGDGVERRQARHHGCHLGLKHKVGHMN
eukprot:1182336-Prorocentrum_minimum.AAC.4